ncbi:MAG: carboxy-S-adenosyl-L-methionine synthase CmoA [Xanthomonadales bacterium]|nr:carboxy-S-adenosyl-L-methionine synthase CmoA [Xanthomonadales bacterium]
MTRDTLYSDALGEAAEFRFDERVVRVFPDMIQRSVPGYALTVPLVGMLARRFAQDGSKLYDLGCSLGAVTLAMRRAVQADDVRIVAVDNAPAMVERCRAVIDEDNSSIPVEVIEADVRETPVENASVVVMHYTLQFVPPADRLALLRRVHAGLREGGVLLLAEKIAFEDEGRAQRQSDWHHDFKRAQGYSDLEIAQKRAALERVLQADSETAHRERLASAGFSRVDRWFQCFNFAAWIAAR